MNPELAWMVAIFWIGRKPRCELSMASASQTVRTAVAPSGLTLCGTVVMPLCCRHGGGAKVAPLKPVVPMRGEFLNDYGDRPDSEQFRSAPRTSRPPYDRLMVPENRAHGPVGGPAAHRGESPPMLDMKRREFIALIGGGVLLLAAKQTNLTTTRYSSA